MKHNFLVYLAGPITGLTYCGATSWRDYVIDNLPEHLVGMSPLRAKSYLKDEQQIEGSYDETILSSQRGLFARDFFDCNRCDALFVNLRFTEVVSIGTVMEIAWAYQNRIPVVLVMGEEDEIHNHPMIREACPFVVGNIDEGIHTLAALLLPVSH